MMSVKKLRYELARNLIRFQHDGHYETTMYAGEVRLLWSLHARDHGEIARLEMTKEFFGMGMISAN